MRHREHRYERITREFVIRQTFGVANPLSDRHRGHTADPSSADVAFKCISQE